MYAELYGHTFACVQAGMCLAFFKDHICVQRADTVDGNYVVLEHRHGCHGVSEGFVLAFKVLKLHAVFCLSEEAEGVCMYRFGNRLALRRFDILVGLY